MPTGVYKRIIGVNCGLPTQGFQKGHLSYQTLDTKRKIREARLKNNPGGFKKGHLPYNTIESNKKISEAHKGVKLSEEHKKNISKALKGKIPKNLNFIHTNREILDKRNLAISGENNYGWITDRTLLKKDQERNDSAYQNWVKQVKKRDKGQCKINNKDCSGYCIVHHILPWRDFPELRYEINNGITLCQAHHPRKRAEEKRLIPFFQGLIVEQSKF